MMNKMMLQLLLFRFVFKRWWLKIQCRLTGEIYFDKYDIAGPYHWEYYYVKQEPFYVATVDAICKLLPQNTHVLDIGCGDGLIANVISEQKGCTVEGIDVQPLAITFARMKNHNANMFHVKSVYDIEYNQMFDIVIAIEIFEHIANPTVLLSKAYMALKQEGFLIISTPLANETKPPAKYHVKEYTREEFVGYLNPLFVVKEDVIVHRPDGKSDCYICLCSKYST